MIENLRSNVFDDPHGRAGQTGIVSWCLKGELPMHPELFSAMAEWDAAVDAVNAFLEEVPACFTSGWVPTTDQADRRRERIVSRLLAANRRLTDAVVAHSTLDEHLEIMLECAREIARIREHRALFELLDDPDENPRGSS